MVTHNNTQYYGEDEHSLYRRCSLGGLRHHLSNQDLPQRVSFDPYSGHRTAQDSRSGGHDQSGTPRRRIPVACGRCRKRKIRCSGDPGNGGPCSNCKQAGNNDCAFLRVSSTEAQLKGETSDYAFDPSSAGPRVHCRMVTPYGPATHFAPPTPLGVDGYPSYRQNSLSYPYNYKYYGTSFSDYGEDNVDYGVHGLTYPGLSQEHLASLPSGSVYSTPGHTGNQRWAAPVTRHSPLFVENDSPYTHTQYAGFPPRPPLQHESKGLSLSGMATSLPTPVAVVAADRPVLPYPTAGRPFLRTSESMSALQGPVSRLDSLGSYNDGLLSTSIMKALNNNSVAENASLSNAYLPLSTSSESISSSQVPYSSQPLQTSQQHQQQPSEMYTPQSDSSGPSLYSSMAGSDHRSSDDLRSYAHDSVSSKRPSLSHSTDRSGSISEGSPKLSNGRYYVPPVNPTGYYPPPPMATGPPTPASMTGSHRRSSGIQAS